MLDINSKQLRRNKHYHEHYRPHYRLKEWEIDQILGFEIEVIDVSLK